MLVDLKSTQADGQDGNLFGSKSAPKFQVDFVITDALHSKNIFKP
jgi:hypothetical protein